MGVGKSGESSGRFSVKPRQLWKWTKLLNFRMQVCNSHWKSKKILKQVFAQIKHEYSDLLIWFLLQVEVCAQIAALSNSVRELDKWLREITVLGQLFELPCQGEPLSLKRQYGL